MTAFSRPKESDAIGSIIQRYWRGGPERDAVEGVLDREDGVLQKIDPSQYFVDYEQMSMPEKLLTFMCEGRILDLGCKAGSFSLALKGKGHDVIGLDPSPGAVAVSSSRGVPTLRGELWGPFGDVGAIDTFVLAAGSLGLFGSQRQGEVILGAMAAVAHSGARIVGTGITLNALSDDSNWEYYLKNIDNMRMPGQVRFRVHDRDALGDWYDYLYLSADDIRRLVRDTPWQIEDIGIEQNLHSITAILRLP